MSSTNKTSLGLNMWEASDKPVRQDFINDNVIIDEKVSKLEQDFSNGNVIINEKITKLNSNLNNKANNNDLNTTNQQVVKLSSGIAPTDYDLLSWAKDDPTRRSIWKIENTSMVGTPNDSVEWCCLNFKDPSGSRGVIIAIQYGGTAVKRRDYFNGAWLQSNWVSIIG